MKTHFCTGPVKNLIDGEEWRQHYPGFYELDMIQQNEVKEALQQSAAGPLLGLGRKCFYCLLSI